MDHDENLDVISAVAEQRRREAQVAIERKLPEWILEIVRSEVVYTINPRMLPFNQASFPMFAQMLREKYYMKFKRPDLGPLGSNVSLTDDELGSVMMSRLENQRMRFESGRFPKSRNEFVVIGSVNMDNESIGVVVEGVSEIADLIVADVAEMVWVSAGMQRPWDDIKRGVQLIGYATTTMVDLGFPPERLLNSKLLDFIKSQMLAGKKYACDMGRRSIRHNFMTSPSLTSTFALEEFNLNFHLFDTVTGRSESVRLGFRITVRDYAATGRVLVFSELPFDRHVECIESLMRAIQQD